MSARSLAEARLRGRPGDGEDTRGLYRGSIGWTWSTSRWYYDPEAAGIGSLPSVENQGTERAGVDVVAPAQGQKTLSNVRQSGRKQEEKQRTMGASMENGNASKAGDDGTRQARIPWRRRSCLRASCPSGAATVDRGSSSGTIDRPKGLKLPLRPYQSSGICVQRKRGASTHILLASWWSRERGSL
ncbi:hypothetical protein S40285_09974 [Stachybotrys chlorohalonatus IBT 40285]|uniref:Uncharacterized protein n=1 Tax=Stachybotrys chlorohalonatus (strain IBT 40285) TaxID=1283841 RepID=A0A084QSJ3_STAC4|nr:hypothetical protein S40285_09974 [Stachybotrys chlorohalonata IBT 40285]